MLIHDYLKESARRFPDKTAIIFENKRLTYHEINQKSDRIAEALISIGCIKQDRIIIFMANSAETVISIYGILKAGCMFVVINPSQKTKKLNYILKDTGSKTVIAETNKVKIIASAIEGTDVDNVIWCAKSERVKKMSVFEKQHKVINVYDWYHLVEHQSKLNDTKLPLVVDIDLAGLFYTSGTTGTPKGIMTAHYNADAVMQSQIQIFKNNENDIILNALPFSFDYGLYQVFMAFAFGGTVIIIKSFLYPHKIVELMSIEKATVFPFVPSMAALLFQMEDIKKFDFSNLRYITTTSASLPKDYIPRLKEIFPKVKLFSRYGVSESATTTYLPPGKINDKPDSVGIALPNTEVFIVDKDDHKVCAGQIGELVIRGNHVTQGYWRAPERTKKVFKKGNYRSDTLLYTGDLFHQDDEGYLYFVSRKDDLLKTGGERVSPKEVENVIMDIDGVMTAAVIGVPDDILGIALKAFVLPDMHHSLDERKVREYCIKNLESYMVPKYIDIRSEIPRTENGKVNKKLLCSQES